MTRRPAAGCPATSSTRSRNDPPHARGAADDRPSPSPPLGHPHPRGPRPRTAPRPAGARADPCLHPQWLCHGGGTKRCAGAHPLRHPRSGLRPEGVTEGTELFRGTLENGYLSGLALIFRSGCGRLDYYVYGDFRLGESFTLTGAAPVLARQGCAVIDNTYDGPNANLVFTAARVGAAPTPPPGPGPRLCVNGIVATSSLNLRTGPGLGYGVIGEIPANACDVIAGPAAASGWQAVRWQGRLGWASSTYLRAAP